MESKEFIQWLKGVIEFNDELTKPQVDKIREKLESVSDPIARPNAIPMTLPYMTTTPGNIPNTGFTSNNTGNYVGTIPTMGNIYQENPSLGDVGEMFEEPENGPDDSGLHGTRTRHPLGFSEEEIEENTREQVRQIKESIEPQPIGDVGIEKEQETTPPSQWEERPDEVEPASKWEERPEN